MRAIEPVVRLNAIVVLSIDYLAISAIVILEVIFTIECHILPMHELSKDPSRNSTLLIEQIYNKSK